MVLTCINVLINIIINKYNLKLIDYLSWMTMLIADLIFRQTIFTEPYVRDIDSLYCGRACSFVLAFTNPIPLKGS